MDLRPFRRARLLALLVPALLLAGVWSFQLIGGYAPCEMCHWQRWPHYAALVAALLAVALPSRADLTRLLIIVAALLIVASGAVGIFHAGVEYHWWKGPSRCTGGGFSGADPLRALLSARIALCDVAQWRLFGISLAGWNAIVSIPSGFYILALCLKRRGR